MCAMEMGWIPTSERLPEDNEEILFVFWHECGLTKPVLRVLLGRYYEPKNAVLNYNYGWIQPWSELTYWMPLLPPPGEMVE